MTDNKEINAGSEYESGSIGREVLEEFLSEAARDAGVDPESLVQKAEALAGDEQAFQQAKLELASLETQLLDTDGSVAGYVGGEDRVKILTIAALVGKSRKIRKSPRIRWSIEVKRIAYAGLIWLLAACAPGLGMGPLGPIMAITKEPEEGSTTLPPETATITHEPPTLTATDSVTPTKNGSPTAGTPVFGSPAPYDFTPSGTPTSMGSGEPPKDKPTVTPTPTKLIPTGTELKTETSAPTGTATRIEKVTPPVPGEITLTLPDGYKSYEGNSATDRSVRCPTREGFQFCAWQTVSVTDDSGSKTREINITRIALNYQKLQMWMPELGISPLQLGPNGVNKDRPPGQNFIRSMLTTNLGNQLGGDRTLVLNPANISSSSAAEPSVIKSFWGSFFSGEADETITVQGNEIKLYQVDGIGLVANVIDVKK